MSKIVLRHATLEDGDFLYRLRADPETMANSLDQRPILKDEHLAWLTKTITRSQYVHLYIAELANPLLRVGTGRLDRIASELYKKAEVSLTVAPELRHQGYGGELLDVLVLKAKHLGYEAVTAWVKRENETSLKLFLRHGFTQLIGDASPIRLERRL